MSVTTTADDVENTKPAPDIFATALKKLAPLGPEEVIVVGDTPYDIEAAAKCGIAAIDLRSGKFTDEVLLGAGRPCCTTMWPPCSPTSMRRRWQHDRLYPIVPRAARPCAMPALTLMDES